MKELIDKVDRWAEKVGLSPIENQVSLDYVSKVADADLSSVSLDKIQEAIVKISAYNLYLKYLKSSVEAERRLIEVEFKSALYKRISELQNDDAEFKYNVKEQKEHLAISTDPELLQVQKDLLAIQMQYSKLASLPYAIDTIIDNLKLIYKRRMYELQQDNVR